MKYTITQLKIVHEIPLDEAISQLALLSSKMDDVNISTLSKFIACVGWFAAHANITIAALRVAKDVKPVSTERASQLECPCCGAEWWFSSEEHLGSCSYAALRALIEETNDG